MSSDSSAAPRETGGLATLSGRLQTQYRSAACACSRRIPVAKHRANHVLSMLSIDCCVFMSRSCIHQDAPTHPPSRERYDKTGGPPTSSAVLVNLGNAALITEASLPTESGARPPPAMSGAGLAQGSRPGNFSGGGLV